MQGMPDILGMLSGLGGSGDKGGGLGGLGGLGGIAGALGGLGGISGGLGGGSNPMGILSMIGSMSQLGGNSGSGGGIGDILGMLSGNQNNPPPDPAANNPNYDAEPSQTNKTSNNQSWAASMGYENQSQEAEAQTSYTPIAKDPCANCPINCDRARLGLPQYEEIRKMAADWQRF